MTPPSKIYSPKHKHGVFLHSLKSNVTAFVRHS